MALPENGSDHCECLYISRIIALEGSLEHFFRARKMAEQQKTFQHHLDGQVFLLHLQAQFGTLCSEGGEKAFFFCCTGQCSSAGRAADL